MVDYSVQSTMQGEFGDKENKRRTGNQIEREPVELPTKAWLSSQEENEQQLSSPVGSPLSYHIDLDEKTDSQGSHYRSQLVPCVCGCVGSDSAAATTSVKVIPNCM